MGFLTPSLHTETCLPHKSYIRQCLSTEITHKNYNITPSSNMPYFKRECKNEKNANAQVEKLSAVFLGCTLTVYDVAAMLSKLVPSKRAAEREGATLIIALLSN